MSKRILNKVHAARDMAARVFATTFNSEVLPDLRYWLKRKKYSMLEFKDGSWFLYKDGNELQATLIPPDDNEFLASIYTELPFAASISITPVE